MHRWLSRIARPIAALVGCWPILLLGAPPGCAGVPAPVPRYAALASGVSAPAYRAPAGSYRWPLDGQPAVVRRFEPPPRRWLPGHRGVDLAGGAGAVVRAAGPGRVAFAGPIAGRGVVSIEHRGGLRTTYEPVTATVRAGDEVALGAAIGALASGHAGCPVAACLHWGLRRGDTYLDPLSLLGLGRVRLLPLDPAQEGG
jgi:murein DD-endopeptidase MepM/ murein hydrolase activator NlpD